ncbi:MAG TPA: hypothetical protein VLA21_00555, partial [Candidatus Limnocylindria bacterium]|nr:hypothetical protein [Candidatus Limnocylindria bacterium]
MDGYAYQRPLGKIEDDPALRNLLIAVFDGRTKEDAVRFGLAYGRHLLDVTGFAPCVEVAAAFEAMQRWLDGVAS